MKLIKQGRKDVRFFCKLLTGTVVLASLTGCGVSTPVTSAGEGSGKYDVPLDDSEATKGDSEKSDKSTDSDDSSDSESKSSGGDFDEKSKDVTSKTKEIEDLIDKYFYFEEDESKREESYYDGLLKGLDDPYSVYYTKEEYERLKEDDSGSFEGIGATVSKNLDNGTVYIVKPFVGSPAEKAGILPDDVIVGVDDMEVTSDMELDYVVKHMRGEKGTKVTLKIYREGESDFLYIDVIRDTIENITVEGKMLDNNVGYIQVEQFIETTPELFKEQVDSLLADGAEKLVIDLRNNPGGLLDAVIEMVDYIVDDDAFANNSEEKGLLLQTKDKNDTVLEEFRCDDGHSVNVPIAVLVNGNSASASEIFSGCLKDYGVAKIVGTTTYGKGIVQSVVKLSDGSAIKITIAQYFLPSGTAVHKVGVKPDVEEELKDELKRKVEIKPEEDNQLQKAIETLGK